MTPSVCGRRNGRLQSGAGGCGCGAGNAEEYFEPGWPEASARAGVGGNRRPQAGSSWTPPGTASTASTASPRMGNLAQFALVTVTSVLFIVDPIAVIPTYLVITQGETTAQRAVTARRACVAAAFILVGFALGGALIFQLFGITIEAFRIAGGLILWVVAMDMLHGQRRTQESQPEISEGQAKDDVAITPLAM